MVRRSNGSPAEVIGRHAIPLPTGIDTATPVTYAPGLSLIHLPESVTATLGPTLGVCQFPVVAAAEYGFTPVADTLCRLTRRAETAISEFMDAGGESARLADRLVPIETGSRLLAQSFRPVLGTVLRWRVDRLLASSGLRDRYARAYASDNPSVDEEAVREALARLREELTGTAPAPTFDQQLRTLADTYSSSAAALVARLTMHPDTAVVSGPASTIDLRAAAAIDFVSRARQFAGAFETVVDEPMGPDIGAVERAVVSATDCSVSGLAGTDRHPPPLLSGAHRVPAQDELMATEHPELAGSPSGLAWLLAKAFADGGIGGAVYTHPATDRRWLLNPWADLPTDSGTYRSRWERIVVVDTLLEQLFTATLADSSDVSIGCPFCTLAATQCGNSSCRHEGLIESVRSHVESLQKALADGIDELADRYARVFEEAD